MPSSSRPEPTDTASWLLIVAMIAACLIAMIGLGFRIDPTRAMPAIATLALLAGAALVGQTGARPRLRAGAVAFLQMTLFTIVGVILSYALAARGGPLWDDRFAAADRLLGFDWPMIVGLADRSGPAIWIGGLAYHSLILQMIVCIVVLSATAQTHRLRIATAAAIASGFATIMLSGAMPAMGNVFDPADHAHLWPSVAWLERDLIAGLRDGSWRTLDLTQLMGIVTFPSYHATLPIILAWAQRDVRGWNIVAALWAALTIVATPLFGGHYAIDVLAGAGLAVAGLAIAPRLVTLTLRAAPRRRSVRLALRPSGQASGTTP